MPRATPTLSPTPAASEAPRARRGEPASPHSGAASPKTALPSPAPSRAPVPTNEASPPVASGTAAASPASAPRFVVNVGLFAQAENAQRVRERLLQAGLPALVDEVSMVNGLRTRVRVGPYEQKSQADEAGAAVRALGLDSVVLPMR